MFQTSIFVLIRFCSMKKRERHRRKRERETVQTLSKILSPEEITWTMGSPTMFRHRIGLGKRT